MRVAIAFTDSTRSSPDRLLVGGLLREIEAAGVAPGDVTLLCAVGLHRPTTHRERVEKLGDEIAARYRVVDHDAFDGDRLVNLGTIDGIPVIVNRLCVEADLLMATGVVEPHQYAGYSGGSKTVVIGCSGEATIEGTHGAAMLDTPGVALGSVEGNPFQRFVRRAGALARLRHVANVLQDEEGKIITVAGGPPDAVHDHLVAVGRSLYEIPVERPAHLAVAGVSPAKGTNLYQASRAATYLALADRTPLLPGAPIIIPTDLPEGTGAGEGEKRFHAALSGAASPAALIEELRATGFPAGAQRAYILAKALTNHPVIIAGAADPAVVRACHMIPARDMGEAIGVAERLARTTFALPDDAPLELLALPNALIALPRLTASKECRPI